MRLDGGKFSYNCRAMVAALQVDDRPATAPSAEEPACLYCGSSRFVPLHDNIRDRLGHVPGVWSFVRCQECGSANLRPFPKAEDLPAFYPPVYTFSPELAQSPLKRVLAALEYRLFFQPVYRAQVRIVDRHIRRRRARPGKLLDIGSGRGLRLLEFRSRGYDVHGVDFAPESVEFLEKTHQIPAVCSDIDGLTAAFEPASFDVVTAFYVLEHLVDVDHALRQCLRLLKPGGWLVGAVPLNDSLQARALGAWNVNVREAPRHISIPTQDALVKLARRAGFSHSSVRIASDSILCCAALVGLSLITGCATTNVYGGTQRYFGLARRLFGASVACASIPWVVIENRLLNRPILGLLIGQKPIGPESSAPTPESQSVSR
jgi:SAM-dependent methyltransferase